MYSKKKGGNTMNKQKILLSLTTVIMTGATLFAVPSVYAQTPGAGTHMNFFQELIQFISQKFGLDKTQVQTAITDFQQQKKATITPRPTLTQQQMTDREKTRLDQLVKDGKITGDQENAIIAELAVLRAKYTQDSLKNLTPDQRKTQMTARRDEILAWAKSHGIDSSYLMPGFGMEGRGFGMGGRGPGMGGKGMGEGKEGWGREWNEKETITPTQ
jgi:hypothetical protein